MSIGAALLPEFDMEMANTRKVLARLPEDKFSFKPHAKSWDMISLATHIARMTGWASMTMNSDSFDYAPPGQPEYKEEPLKSVAELLSTFDKGVAETREALEKADDAAFMAPWSLLAGGKTVFTMPRVAVLRGMIFNHVIHHRGQLTLYLRLNDVPVPALYGPSADETE